MGMTEIRHYICAHYVQFSFGGVDADLNLKCESIKLTPFININ